MLSYKDNLRRVICVRKNYFIVMHNINNIFRNILVVSTSIAYEDLSENRNIII